MLMTAKKPALKLTALLAVLMLVTACARTGGVECAGWRAIPLDDQSIDGLTDQDAAAILAHNEFGKRRGCW